MAEIAKDEQEPAGGNMRKGQFSVQKIYVKDISLETPHSPMIFSEEWAPSVNMQLASHANPVNEDFTEVILSVTVTTSLGEKTAYLVEAHIAGIFMIKEFPPEIVEHMAATVCPNILFPFARELVCDLVTRGGFPQLLLAPVNFEALYTQHKQQEKMKVADGAADPKLKH